MQILQRQSLPLNLLLVPYLFLRMIQRMSSSKILQVIEASDSGWTNGKEEFGPLRLLVLLHSLNNSFSFALLWKNSCTALHCADVQCTPIKGLVKIRCSTELEAAHDVSVSVFLTRGCTAPLCVHSVAASVLVPKPFCSEDPLRALS